MRLIKYLDNQIRKIPDFKDEPRGKRNAMKGLSSFVLGTALTTSTGSLDPFLIGGCMLIGYTGVGIIQTIKSEIKLMELEYGN